MNVDTKESTIREEAGVSKEYIYPHIEAVTLIPSYRQSLMFI